VLKWLTTTDHKVIGLSYMITSLVMFYLAGIMALVIRLQLASPSSSLLSFSSTTSCHMHGSLMLYLFAGPFAFGGLANYIVPLQVGAPDMAFPRLNALSYWLYAGGSITMLLSFFVAGGASSFGWWPTPRCRTPRTHRGRLGHVDHGAGPDGFSAIFTGVNLVATIFYLRAPGMTMFRMPIFTWNMLVTGILILIAFPVLTAALIMLYCDRHFGTHIFTVSGGGVPVLWQHLFWFFGHPEVYILALPFFGIARGDPDVLEKAGVRLQGHGLRHVVDRRPLDGGLGAPHVHDRRGAAALLQPVEPLDRRADRHQVLQLDRHHVAGQLSFKTPMLFCIGFLFAFLMGGVTGVMLAAPASTSSPTTRTSWSPTSTRSSSAPPCSPASPGCTSGTRRCSAGCSRTSSASGTSGCCSSGSG